MSNTKPHKHAEVIKAWADGRGVEYRFHYKSKLDPTIWRDCDIDFLLRNPEAHYRPAPVKYQKWVRMVLDADGVIRNYHCTADPACFEHYLPSGAKWIGDWVEYEVDAE
jgi:hypothetical protein